MNKEMEDKIKADNPGVAIIRFDYDLDGSIQGFMSIDRSDLLKKCEEKFNDAAIQKMVQETGLAEPALRNMTFLAYIKASPHWQQHRQKLKDEGVDA